jgi:hypothetical protein
VVELRLTCPNAVLMEVNDVICEAVKELKKKDSKIGTPLPALAEAGAA